jgi:hypothetical protein
MKENTTKIYKNYQIYLNSWGEYCVCNFKGEMLMWNSSRKTLKEAKKYIDNYIDDCLAQTVY